MHNHENNHSIKKMPRVSGTELFISHNTVKINLKWHKVLDT